MTVKYILSFETTKILLPSRILYSVKIVFKDEGELMTFPGHRKFQASDHGLVFLVTSPHPVATQRHYIGTKDSPGVLSALEFIRVLGALCQGQGQRQIIEQKVLLVLLSLWKLQGS